MKKQVKRFAYLLLSFMLLVTTMLGLAGPVSAGGSTKNTPTLPTPPALPVALNTLASGDLVVFAGWAWNVLDPSTGYLLRQRAYGSDQPFDSTDSQTFDPSSPTNIAYYLNNTFYNSLPAADQALIQPHSWTTGNETDESSGSVTCKIGLISLSEYKEYKDDMNSNLSETSNWWTRTPASDLTGNIWTVGALPLFNKAPQIFEAPYPANKGGLVRPALYLDPNVLVSPERYSKSIFDLIGSATASSTEPAIQVNINGSPLQMDVPPTIVNGRTLVPLRAIFEALGATVQWNAADQSIVATKGNITINLQIGSTTALNNGAQVTLDAAPQIVNGRTLVPARFVSEALGAQVNWDATNRQVNITTTS
jgi:hypothetical protein